MTKEDVIWVYRERKYRFRFTIAARDIDAVVYESFLTFTHAEREATEYHGTNWLQPDWSELKRIKP
jgi:hypothetical protein